MTSDPIGAPSRLTGAGRSITIRRMIRTEISSDREAITRILIEAFADHPYSHQTEHLIVDGLRRSDALTVSLVAEVDGNVVGHVAFSPVKIDGVDCMWFALGYEGQSPIIGCRR